MIQQMQSHLSKRTFFKLNSMSSTWIPHFLLFFYYSYLLLWCYRWCTMMIKISSVRFRALSWLWTELHLPTLLMKTTYTTKLCSGVGTVGANITHSTSKTTSMVVKTCVLSEQVDVWYQSANRIANTNKLAEFSYLYPLIRFSCVLENQWQITSTKMQ